MKKIIINGKFLGDRMQGIVRYATELTLAMDKIVGAEDDVTLLLPPNVETRLPLERIKQETYGKRTGIKWEMRDLSKYMRKHKEALCLNLCNVAPLRAPAGVTVIHDIMYKVNPSHYTTLRNKLSRAWHCYQYKLITKRERAILTVSHFSKEEIARVYPVAKDKIDVVYSAWQHVLSYRSSEDWQEKYPFLKEKEFYFSLSTLSKNKNGKWIVEVAKRNPQATFAIGGKYYETEDYEIPSNVHMLGFISDEDACALMKNCKAFIHPSLYEGFGLPPLEAIALGAEAICSNVTALPEVYGKGVHYVDPYDYEVNIDELLAQEVAPREEILNKYGWDKSAKKLLGILRSL